MKHNRTGPQQITVECETPGETDAMSAHLDRVVVNHGDRTQINLDLAAITKEQDELRARLVDLKLGPSDSYYIAVMQHIEDLAAYSRVLTRRADRPVVTVA